MIFEYLPEEVFTKQLDLVDIGNTALRLTTKAGDEFYLVLKTVMGKTSILKFGPVMSDVQILLDYFSLLYKKVDYKEITLQKEIKLFIQDPKKEIALVEEIVDEEALAVLPDILQSWRYLEE